MSWQEFEEERTVPDSDLERTPEMPFRLGDLVVHLEDGPAATTLVRGEDFFRRVEASDRFRAGRLVGVARAREPGDLHEDTWEMHPAGDELLVLLSGALDLVLEEAAGERTLTLHSGDTCVVPRGTWHRFAMREPSELLFVVRGDGTRQRAVGA